MSDPVQHDLIQAAFDKLTVAFRDPEVDAEVALAAMAHKVASILAYETCDDVDAIASGVAFLNNIFSLVHVYRAQAAGIGPTVGTA